MSVNKVELKTGEVLLDVSKDTMTEDTLFDGVTGHDAQGNPVTGKFPNGEIDVQAELIEQIKSTLESKASGGLAKEEQEKTVDITENGTVEVIPDEGKALSKVIVNVNVESDGGVGIDGMPSGYARVDYIQFTGKELIDTGIIGNQDTQINTSFTWESTTQRHLFGCASEDNTASITSYMNGSWRFGNKYASKNLSTKNPKLPYSALMNKTTISLNSSIASISGMNDFETVGTLLLGGARDTDGSLPSVMITGKVFFFNMWQGEELALKLVPVVSAEGQYRFFDLVSKTFFDSITDTTLSGGNL